jgi:hypothetical protein
MGVYRDTDGIENSDPSSLLARAFTAGDATAVVVCTAKDAAARGTISVPGRRLVSWSGIDAPTVEETADGVRLELPPNALAVLEFGK